MTNAGAGLSWTAPSPGLWLRTWRLGEWLNAPLSPLFETFLVPILVDARERAGTRALGVRLPRMWRVRQPAYVVVNGYYFARAEPVRWTTMLLPIRFLISQLFGGWIDRWTRRALPRFLEQLAAHRAQLANGPSDRALLRICEDVAPAIGDMWYALCLAAGGLVPYQRFLRKLGAAVVAPDDGIDESVFIRGLATPVLQEQEQLCELALFVREHPAVARWLDEHTIEELLEQPGESPQLTELAARIRGHLDRFGHQVRSLDVAAPGLAEEPERLSIGLRCYLEPDAARPSEIRVRLDEQRERAVAQIRAAASRRKLRLFNVVLVRAQAHVVARDTASFHLQMAWPLLRSALLELGRRLAERSVLAQPDDVFYVTRDELWGTTRGEPLVSRETVAERRAILKERAAMFPPPAIPPVEDAAWDRAMRWPLNLRELLRSDTERRIVVGTPASPGRIQARARVLGFPSEHARVERGEVLVTVTTTPDWTPLFARAGAVVTDVGAVSSHSAVVAREYGIPAVVATQTATTRIRDGQIITVDGSEGRIYLQ